MKTTTITVRTITRTAKGVVCHALSGEEYLYTTLTLDDALAIPGNVANITYDEKTMKISDAMLISNMPNAVELADKLDKAKAKTTAFLAPPPAVPAKPKAPPNAMNKSVSLAYAKDLIVAGKLQLADMLPCAEVFYQFMTGELEVLNLYPPLLQNVKVKCEEIKQ
jgi:hypothetical protein